MLRMAGSKGSKNVNSLMTESSHYSPIYLPINHLCIYYLCIYLSTYLPTYDLCLSLHCWSLLLDKLSAIWRQEGIRQPLLPIFPSKPLHYKGTFSPNVHISIPGKQNKTLVSPVWITWPPLLNQSFYPWGYNNMISQIGSHAFPHLNPWLRGLEWEHTNIFDN